MKPIIRDKCVINNEKDLEHLYSFNNFPVFMGCVSDRNLKNDILLDMNFFISKTTGIVQLNPLVPLDILYQDSHGSGSIGESWKRHHESFANFILQFNVKNIFEIGGGHGILAQKYINKKNNALWTILDANPSLGYEHQQIKFQKGIFTNEMKIDNNIDAIVHSHLFEHIYEPQEFIEKLYDSLQIGAYTIFSIPYLEQQIKENITYCLGFEHTIFLNEKFIEYLLEYNGFNVIEKKIYEFNHSIFYCAQKVENKNQKTKIPSLYNDYKELFTKYFEYNLKKVEEINNLILSAKDEIYLFGGHIASQYLINYGLNTSKIKMILDNDANKHGKRLYGTNLFVQSPIILKGKCSANVILRQGVFNDEIKEDILNNINKNVQFWE